MNLTGSRAAGSEDAFSDWDYLVESPADLPEVETMIQSALCWTHVKKGSLRVTTLITPDFRMIDYDDKTGLHEGFWQTLQAVQKHHALAEYWILAFKHLKTLHRRLDLFFLDVGMDISVSLLRDLYVERNFGPGAYRSFFDYKRIPPGHDFSSVLGVTGMATVTREDRIEKLRAMNLLVCEMYPAGSARLHQGFDEKLAQATSA